MTTAQGWTGDAVGPLALAALFLVLVALGWLVMRWAVMRFGVGRVATGTGVLVAVGALLTALAVRLLAAPFRRRVR